MQWLAWYRNSIFWKFRNALGFNKFALYAKIFEKQKQILQKKKVEKKKKAKLNWCKIEVVTDLENTVTENQFSKTIMSRGENGQPWWVTESFTSHSKCNILHSGMKASYRFLKDLVLRNQYWKWWNFLTYFPFSKTRTFS